MYSSRTVRYNETGLVCDFLGSLHPVTQTITQTNSLFMSTTRTHRTEILLKGFVGAPVVVYQLQHSSQQGLVSQAHAVLLPSEWQTQTERPELDRMEND